MAETAKQPRSPLALAAHVVLVGLICASWSGALAFFALSAGVVWVAGRARARARSWVVGLGALTLVGALLALRGSPALVRLGLGPLVEAGVGLEFVGLSYAFLRAVYALLEPRRWTLTGYARYFFFAPTFVSGPITRPEDHDAAHRPDRSDLRAGCERIGYGLICVLLAQLLRTVCALGSRDQLFWAVDMAGDRPLVIWGGLLLSGLWLYLDFSGFSDVFIGLARLTGVRAPENFARPYGASDITAFWQRWHLSLAEWLRGVIYTPLSAAGLRWLPRSAVAALAPLVTMGVCGLWHGVSPAYALWGLAHGAALGGHALWRQAAPDGAWRRSPPFVAASWLVTHLFVAATWALFLPVDPGLPLQARFDLLHRLAGL